MAADDLVTDERAATRIRLDIAYDGGDFNGWMRQPELRTVQGDLEAALETIFSRSSEPPTLTVAGRTDAGVHAVGQVAHLDLSEKEIRSLARPRGKSSAPKAIFDTAATLARRINGILSLESDIYVTRASLAPEGFDARFSAIWRRYQYRVADNAGPRNPLERNRTLWYPARLDLDLMNQAAESLLGLHDWAAYCKPRIGATTIRTLEEFFWTREPDGVLVAHVKADAFCHSMVRSLVGASIAAGQHKLEVDRLVIVRDELERTSEFKVMPAKGLVLVEVGYPEDSELGPRAIQTRARRAFADAAASTRENVPESAS
ncbi:tRNA pseudouridine(38-40) synthase TruA [Glaciihabitans sp. UYNi722]|uniref:tRNA pseudouridine(38-40) synthase TruA n=1 Tax=Glaciihabitans sp. UYNi722 TaxID=3156344 RepID=UPI003398C009